MRQTDEDAGRPGLLYLTARHLYRTAVYTPINFLGVTFVTVILSVTALARPSNPTAKYVLLAVAGWAIYLGQLQALDVGGNSTEEYSRFTTVLLWVSGILYYNLTVLGAAVFGFAAANAGLPEVGLAVAFLGPVTDMELSRDYGVGLGIVLFSLSKALGERTTETYEDSRIAYVVENTTGFLALAKDAVPPILRKLSLTTLLAFPKKGR